MLGKYAEITRDPVAPILKGLTGKITRMKEHNGRVFYEITAENFGPRLLGRNVLAWKRGDRRSVMKSCLSLIEDEKTTT